MRVFNEDILKKGKDLWLDIQNKRILYEHILLDGNYKRMNIDNWLEMEDETPLLLETKIEENGAIYTGECLFFKRFRTPNRKDRYYVYALKQSYSLKETELDYFGNVSIQEKSAVFDNYVYSYPIHFSSKQKQPVTFLDGEFKIWYTDKSLHASALWDEQRYYEIAKEYYEGYCEKYKNKTVPTFTIFDARKYLANSDYFADMILKAFFSNTKEEQMMENFYAGFGGINVLARPHGFSLFYYGRTCSFAEGMKRYQQELVKNYSEHAKLFHGAKCYMKWVWMSLYDDKNCKNIQILRKIKETFPSGVPNSFKIILTNGVTEYSTKISKENLLRCLLRDDFLYFFKKKRDYPNIPFIEDCEKWVGFSYNSDILFSIYHKNKLVYSKI